MLWIKFYLNILFSFTCYHCLSLTTSLTNRSSYIVLSWCLTHLVFYYHSDLHSSRYFLNEPWMISMMSTSHVLQVGFSQFSLPCTRSRYSHFHCFRSSSNKHIGHTCYLNLYHSCWISSRIGALMDEDVINYLGWVNQHY